MSTVLGVKPDASSSSSPALPRRRRKQRALLACRLMVMVLIVLCAFCLFSTMHILLHKSTHVEKKEYDKGVSMKQGTNQVESWKTDSCNKSGNVSTLFSSLSSGDIHKMRRMIALSGNSSCYSRFLPSFVNYTLHRIKHVHNHLNLHIPKSGGTSICSLATEKAEQDTNFTVATTNGCWEGEHFLPLWCHSLRFVPGGDRSEWLDYNNEAALPDPSTATAALCNAMDRKLPIFVMNENYLDHPLCTQQRIYSIVIRNPVDRVMSNERHLLEFGREHEKERLQLIRNNYIVWALSSGTTKHGERLSILPQKEHLEIAKETLLQFDYLLDVTLTFSSSCHDDILYLMGLASGDGENPPHEMKGRGKQNNLALTRKEYKELNLLDIELYEYAQSVMRVDCEFFSLVRQQMKEGKSFFPRPLIHRGG